MPDDNNEAVRQTLQATGPVLYDDLITCVQQQAGITHYAAGTAVAQALNDGVIEWNQHGNLLLVAPMLDEPPGGPATLPWDGNPLGDHD
jgi:hypothetical protein